MRQTRRTAPSFPTASASAASASLTTERSPPSPPPQVASSPTRFESRSTAKARAVRSPAPTQTAPPLQRVEARSINEEERVEGAKYALRPNGTPAPQPPVDLGEDIDRLPALTEPALCLLSQKPGVLYAYWLLPPGESDRSDYKLRLCRSTAEALQVYEEIPVPVERGGWYFQVPENVGGLEVFVQLGYYQDGKFIAAQWQSTARLPSLYASTRTDHRWWISDEDFARMYAAGGGVVAGARRYGWSGSTSSPAAAPGAPSSPQSQTEKRMTWPGNVSSQSK